MKLDGYATIILYVITWNARIMLPAKSISRPPGTAEIHVARRFAALRAESALTLRDVAART
ncbi:MAG TPA: hypothetical protein VFL42_02170, partial [Terriglobales bacterium]|nr:hypothetical protein [Terriglobales bacterium]